MIHLNTRLAASSLAPLVHQHLQVDSNDAVDAHRLEHARKIRRVAVKKPTAVFSSERRTPPMVLVREIATPGNNASVEAIGWAPRDQRGEPGVKWDAYGMTAVTFLALARRIVEISSRSSIILSFTSPLHP